MNALILIKCLDSDSSDEEDEEEQHIVDVRTQILRNFIRIVLLVDFSSIIYIITHPYPYRKSYLFLMITINECFNSINREIVCNIGLCRICRH
jgi:hypothetical protein